MNFDPTNMIKEIDMQYEKLNVLEMEDYLVKTIDTASKSYGEDSPAFAALLNELGGFYRTTSQYDKAESIFLKAKDILKMAVGENDPNYANTINNLAGLYRLIKDYTKSEELFLYSIKIYKDTLPPNSFPYSSALNNLALLYQEMKRYEEAVRLHEEALPMVKNNPNPIIYATSLSNLATAYLELHRTQEAEPLLAEAVDVFKKSFGENDPHYASALNNLGRFYFSIGDNEKAKELLLQALKLREQVFGRNHHEFAKVSDNLSILYEKAGDYTAAEQYARQAADAYLNIFGENHPTYKSSVAALKQLQKILEENKQSPCDKIIQTANQQLYIGKGINLSVQYFTQLGAPMICDQFPEYSNRIAVGLVGEGSECYGFDDEISQDHDWGPSFCLWLTEDDFEAMGRQLQLEYSKLPKHFLGYEIQHENELSLGRRGVFEIGSFYRKYIGLNRPPTSFREWRAIPETNLSVVTNGAVFIDSLGEFTSFREVLKAFYPEDVRLKKIAARCAIMAQTGQYNYSRAIRRSEYVAAHYTLSQFIDAAISATFLLNKQYKPFYKWMHRALRSLPILGPSLHEMFLDLTAEKNTLQESVFDRRIQLIEKICDLIIKELAIQDLSECKSDFLLDHAPVIQSHIQDPDLRAMHIMAE